MKRYKVKELKGIIENMKKGTVYCAIHKSGYPTGCVEYYERYGRRYIGYEHYGSSAVSVDYKNLRWLLEVIFDDCTEIVPAVWSSEYVGYIPAEV